MQLKSLNMLGFKSFFEKTTLQFQPGVTAVVDAFAAVTGAAPVVGGG